MFNLFSISALHIVTIPDRFEVDRATNLLQNCLSSLSVDDEDTLTSTRSLRPSELRHIIRRLCLQRNRTPFLKYQTIRIIRIRIIGTFFSKITSCAFNCHFTNRLTYIAMGPYCLLQGVAGTYYQYTILSASLHM